MNRRRYVSKLVSTSVQIGLTEIGTFSFRTTGSEPIPRSRPDLPPDEGRKERAGVRSRPCDLRSASLASIPTRSRFRIHAKGIWAF
jgi:hypothetical protein